MKGLRLRSWLGTPDEGCWEPAEILTLSKTDRKETSPGSDNLCPASAAWHLRIPEGRTATKTRGQTKKRTEYGTKTMQKYQPD